MIASKKMKQLQWEKVSKAQLGKTVWSKNEEARLEEEVAEKLKMFNVWDKIEDQFKAKEVMYDAISKFFFICIVMYKVERELMSDNRKEKRAGNHQCSRSRSSKAYRQVQISRSF